MQNGCNLKMTWENCGHNQLGPGAEGEDQSCNGKGHREAAGALGIPGDPSGSLGTSTLPSTINHGCHQPSTSMNQSSEHVRTIPCWRKSLNNMNNSLASRNSMKFHHSWMFCSGHWGDLKCQCVHQPLRKTSKIDGRLWTHQLQVSKGSVREVHPTSGFHWLITAVAANPERIPIS